MAKLHTLKRFKHTLNAFKHTLKYTFRVVLGLLKSRISEKSIPKLKTPILTISEFRNNGIIKNK